MDFKQYALSHQNTICLELERVVLLLDKCGRPEQHMKIIHVAGTNGKGSVCSFVAEGLIFAGETVGRFSSPELLDITDTITVNSKSITLDELNALYDRIAPICNEVEKDCGKALSQFEINFVAALLYFSDKKCSYAVVECGMGGIGDATNAMEDSALSVITKISIDHETFLGDSLEKIALNKCGIFKKSSRIISAIQHESVKNIIKSEAGEKNVCFASLPQICGHEDFSEVISFDGIKKIKLSLSGVHQVHNAAVAKEVLCALGFENTVEYALSHASNPARFEQLEPGLFFDGAHNPDGVQNLAESINRYVSDGKKIVFVVGFMADKAYGEAISFLKNLNNNNFKIYTVTVHSNPRSEKAETLCKACQALGFDAEAKDNISQAICLAKQNADLVFAFGSLYMYKEYKNK